MSPIGVAQLEALEPRALEAPPPPSPLLLSQQLSGLGWGVLAAHPAFCILQAVEACEQHLGPPIAPVPSIHSHEATRASDKLLAKGHQGPSLWEPKGLQEEHRGYNLWPVWSIRGRLTPKLWSLYSP